MEEQHVSPLDRVVDGSIVHGVYLGVSVPLSQRKGLNALTIASSNLPISTRLARLITLITCSAEPPQAQRSVWRAAVIRLHALA